MEESQSRQSFLRRLVPEWALKALLAALLRLVYRVEVRGLGHYRKAGKRAVLVVNHVSFLDAPLLVAFLPEKPIFAIDSTLAKRWWMRPLLKLGEVFPLDPTKPLGTKSLIKLIREDRHCMIFPEGRITVTGGLMKIYEGPGLVADKADATLIPIRIDGAQYTPFSRLKGKLRRRLFPKITITVLPPRRFELPADLVGRARRQRASLQLYDIMSEMMFETGDRDQTLFEALRDARSVHGGKKPILEDTDRKPITYRRLLQGAHVLGGRIAAITAPRETVGVLLPNSIGAAVTFFALQAYGRVPAMLNFASGSRNMGNAVEMAEVKTVLTSRRFVEAGRLDETVAELATKTRIRYLEDIRQEIRFRDKLSGLFARWRAGATARRLRVGPQDPAVVLFTSGSEGAPKGVVLSHRNLMANRYQIGALIDFNPTDTVFNAMPIFHSFGLTGGLLLPVLSGVRTFLYPSPLHYRMVPALTYDTSATILFGTDTFLTGYWRRAHPYDFYSLRYVVAGAERVKEETRRAWAEKFGLRILEGYGVTETAPALAANTPMQYKAGTVGRFLPGIKHRLAPVPGLERGGRLIVSGPNIMLGYLRREKPGVIEAPEGGEYDTGDIVDIDDQGFVTILGRAKRFAKVAGEMVSLGAVEDFVQALWPDAAHAVVALPDSRRGEQLVLVTTQPGARREALLAEGKRRGLVELMIPRDIRLVEKIPLLGTGKIDYPAVDRLLRSDTDRAAGAAAG